MYMILCNLLEITKKVCLPITDIDSNVNIIEATSHLISEKKMLKRENIVQAYLANTKADKRLPVIPRPPKMNKTIAITLEN